MNLTELRRRIAAANQRALKPRLSSHELHTYNVLKIMHARVSCGLMPTPTQLSKLATTARSAFKQRVDSAVAAARSELEPAPRAFTAYIEKLTVGDLMYSKALYYKADAAYEKALEALEEVLLDDPTLERFLDRAFSRDAALSPEEMPRLRASKSRHNQVQQTSIKQSRLSAAEAAVTELIYDLTHVPSDDSDDPRTLAKLNAFLKVK